MIAFIQIAYCCTIPLLLILSLPIVSPSAVLLSNRLIATSNLLLVLFSLFLIKQIKELYQLAKQTYLLPNNTGNNFFSYTDGFFIRQILIILLPCFFIFKRWRNNKLLTLAIVLLLYWNNPVAVWNYYNLIIKIPEYLSLFSVVYALLWLSNQFKYQPKTI